MRSPASQLAGVQPARVGKQAVAYGAQPVGVAHGHNPHEKGKLVRSA